MVSLTSHAVMRRETNNLMLWSASPTSSVKGPVHKFYGHMDAVLEFAWRNVDPANDRHEFQLVTWAKDAMIKLWPIGGHLKTMCGEEEEEINKEPVDKEPGGHDGGGSEPQLVKDTIQAEDQIQGAMASITVAASSSAASTPKSSSANMADDLSCLLHHNPSSFNDLDLATSASVPSPSVLASSMRLDILKQEFSFVNFGDKVILNRMDLNKRRCIMQAETHLHLVHLDVRFPTNYPVDPPQFEFLSNTSLKQDQGFAIVKKLRSLAATFSAKNKTCLEPCLRLFEDEMALIIKDEEKDASGVKNRYYKDSNVPYPRISGARFSGNGQLVCFGWTFTVLVPNTDNDNVPKAAMKTPRALSAISGNAAASGVRRPSSNNLSLKKSASAVAAALQQQQQAIKQPRGSLSSGLSNSSGGARHKMVRYTSVPLPSKASPRKANSSESEQPEPSSTFGRMLPLSTKPLITIYNVYKIMPFNLQVRLASVAGHGTFCV